VDPGGRGSRLGIITWRFFSLEEINRREGKKHPWEREWSYGWSMMRIGAVLRRMRHGPARPLVRAAGTALHEEGHKPHDPEVARHLLDELGLDPGVVDVAIGDPTTHDEVRDEHRVVVAGGYGVPTLFFERRTASSVPVVIDPPTEGDAALRLWRAVTAWLEFPHLYELQAAQDRGRRPLHRRDLPALPGSTRLDQHREPGSVTGLVAPPDLGRGALQRRTLRVLVAGQILGGAAIGVGAAVSPLLAEEILGVDTYAGLAFSAFVLGAAMAAVPLSRLMARRGRRPGLSAGYGVAALGAAGVVLAAELASFALLLVALLAFGAGNAANLLARYAAPTSPSPAGGPVPSPPSCGPPPSVPSPGPTCSVPPAPWPTRSGSPARGPLRPGRGVEPRSRRRHRRAPAARPHGGRRAPRHRGARSLPDIGAAPAGLILASPAATVGLVTMVVAHGVMVAVMTMTPLHLRSHGDSLQVVGVVISLHVAGMYALAPVMGAIADRLGPLRLARGAALTLVVATSLSAAGGHRHLLIGAGLLLLGLGWSAATISGASLLTSAVGDTDRVRVQGAADLTMGLVAASGGVGASAVSAAFGYATLSLAGAVVTAVVLGVVLGRTVVTPPVGDVAPA
jgi:MFS family permease